MTSGRRMGLAAAAGVVLAGAFAGCGKTSSCRPGTLFLSVHLGVHASTDELEVDVSVAGEAPRQTTLPLSSSASAGGVEVQFPNGYPAGKDVGLDAKLLSAQGDVLAEQARALVPSGACQAIDLDLGARDAASGDAPADSAGSAGAGGRDGGAGTGGGGAGGAGGAGGGGGCVSSGLENCFNNIDDDCNGMVDCADPACVATGSAVCVALDPTVGPIGVLEGAGATCPSGYEHTTAIMAGLGSGTCSGCSCDPGPVNCSASINDFGTLSLCSLGGAGQFVQTLSSTAAGCSVPAWHLDGSGNIGGVKASAFAMTPSGCTPAGTPTLTPAAWTARGEFCGTSSVGGGCGVGRVCVPPFPGSGCQLLDGTHACPTGATRSVWSTGVVSSETCGGCACGAPTGGSCASAQITVGASGTCSSTVVPAGGAGVCSSLTNPGIEITGATPGSCQAQTALSGNATPTGPKTLCCL